MISFFFIVFLITDSPGDENISIILNGVESELKFITDSTGDKVSNRNEAMSVINGSHVKNQ